MSRLKYASMYTVYIVCSVIASYHVPSDYSLHRNYVNHAQVIMHSTQSQYILQ